MANAAPDSRTPRRFIAVRAATIPTAKRASRPRTNPNADAAFCTPGGHRHRHGQDVVDEQRARDGDARPAGRG